MKAAVKGSLHFARNYKNGTTPQANLHLGN